MDEWIIMKFVMDVMSFGANPKSQFFVVLQWVIQRRRMHKSAREMMTTDNRLRMGDDVMAPDIVISFDDVIGLIDVVCR
jgi:hypothetical protein